MSFGLAYLARLAGSALVVSSAFLDKQRVGAHTGCLLLGWGFRHCADVGFVPSSLNTVRCILLSLLARNVGLGLYGNREDDEFRMVKAHSTCNFCAACGCPPIPVRQPRPCTPTPVNKEGATTRYLALPPWNSATLPSFGHS